MSTQFIAKFYRSSEIENNVKLALRDSYGNEESFFLDANDLAELLKQAQAALSQMRIPEIS